MLKKIIRAASIFAISALIATITLSYIILTDNAKSIAKADLREQSENTIALISHHEKEVLKLRASLDKVKAEANFSNMIKEISLNRGERIIIANRSDGAVKGDSGGVVISNSPPILEFDSDKSSDEFVTIEGIKYFYLHTETDGYDIYNLVTEKRIFMQRNFQLAITVISNLLIYTALFFMIKTSVRSQLIKNISKVTGTLSLINRGKLENQINVCTCSEFSSLNDEINTLIHYIKELLSKTKQNADEQTELAESNADSVQVINDLSDALLQNAEEPIKKN